MSLEELPVEILLKICESLNFEDLVLGLRPLSDQLAAEIDNLVLPELSKDRIVIDGRGIHGKSALKELLKFIRQMKQAGLAKKVFLQNMNLRPMQIPFSSTLVALNVKDCCKLRIPDFESVINKCHSLEEFSFDLGCHLHVLTDHIRQQPTLLEALKRPLRFLMIRWVRNDLIHLNRSHVETAREFLNLFVRHSELELFVSVTAKDKFESYSAACPRELVHRNLNPIVYCTPTNSYALPGLQRFVMGNNGDGQNYNGIKIKSLVLHDLLVKVEDSEFMCVPHDDGTASIAEFPYPIVKALDSQRDTHILYESISTIASNFPELEVLSICDLIHHMCFHDWEYLEDLENLKSFSLHEHYRNKANLEGNNLQAFPDIWSGLAELFKNKNRLKSINMQMTPMSTENAEACLSNGAKSLEELRIIGALVERPKRSADGSRKYEYYVFEKNPFESLQKMSFLTSLELLELPTVDITWIGTLKHCKALKHLSLCWVGLYGSWTWRSALVEFLDDAPALEDLKLKNDCLKVNDIMFEKFPKTLQRILLSSKKRYDPTFINEKQVNQDAVITPASLLQASNILPKLKLLYIESGMSEFAALKLSKAKLEKKIGDQGRLMRVVLRKVFDGPEDYKLSERDDVFFVQDYPEVRRLLPEILKVSTPFTF
ncbi:unnamed protein product [Oikopleura dioica]|uniref:F-box domain-containing protein n=1 Tax=Oikopleura dioica TaxID=34765 RepID=E4XUD1_OIKDI|nr:unnamed protein product [Oikopleura dioica]